MPQPLERATRATDRPLTDPSHDHFQRAPFAKRIAETLISRPSSDSIVVGLYGKWGEGKSTVLNFIRQSLAEEPDKVAVLNFNPWRFSDETQLLVNFFGELAGIINQNLLTDRQRVIKGFGSYVAPLIPSFSLGPVSADISKSLEALLKMAQPEVDEQRQRIEQLIVESSKRVVVIIDDIDRLEKTQIQAVFRLVKLTADFKQTAYLLAFDDAMVARAIGEVFTSGTEEDAGGRTLLAGQNFLEKIIQVPLRLPPARADALLDFCFKRVDEALLEAGIEITQAEAQRIGNSLRNAVLPRLSTPRLAVRYANAIAFSLPLLKGEVNPVDFLLVEVMNVFYPELHKFVASHEALLTGSTRNDSGHVFSFQNKDQGKGEKTVIDLALDRYDSQDERIGALALLCALFPKVRKFTGSTSVFDPGSGPSRLTTDELTLHQHIAASTHFGRYFAYTVLAGDVSDQDFAAFISMPYVEQLRATNGLVGQLGMNTFLQKISLRSSGLDSEQAASLWQVVSIISPDLRSENSGGVFLRPQSEVTQASLLMLQLLGCMAKSERLSILLIQVSAGGTFALAAELTKRILSHREPVMQRMRDGEADKEDELFSLLEWDECEHLLPDALLQRALREAGNQPLYASHPEDACKLMHLYWRLSRKERPVADYVFPYLEANPGEVYHLLEVCSPNLSMNDGPRYRAGFDASKVEMLAKSLGAKLYDMARQLYGPKPVDNYPGDPLDSTPPTPENRLRQFIYLYEQRSKPTPSPEITAE